MVEERKMRNFGLAAVLSFACSTTGGDELHSEETRSEGEVGLPTTNGMASSSTTSSSTTSSSTTSSPGTASSGPDTLSGTDSGSTGECDDFDDPSSLEDLATELPTQSCMEVPDEDELDGIINGEEDVDWYYYYADQGPDLCSMPTFNHVVEAVEDLTVCAYAVCSDFDSAFVLCQGSSTPAISPGGASGCCGKNSARLSIGCLDDAYPEGRVAFSIGPVGPDSFNSCFSYSVIYTYSDL